MSLLQKDHFAPGLFKKYQLCPFFKKTILPLLSIQSSSLSVTEEFLAPTASEFNQILIIITEDE